MHDPFGLSADPSGEIAGLPDELPQSPFPTLAMWLEHATRLGATPNPNAMTLATVDTSGQPSARIVLCRGVDVERGSITFFTNYRGRKSREIESNPRVALVLHFDALDLQARVEGIAAKAAEAVSDAYFAGRRWESKIGAWASDQSEPIASREDLLLRAIEAMRRFGLMPMDPPPPDARIDIPRPAHWGGFEVVAQSVELWVGGTGRMHDRARWTRRLTGGERGPWSSTRLQP